MAKISLFQLIGLHCIDPVIRANLNWVKQLEDIQLIQSHSLQPASSLGASVKQHLVAGEAFSNSQKLWDTVILETEEFILTPSLGSIVPNWLLLWPKTPCLSCIEWKGPDTDLDSVARHALDQLGVSRSTDYIWFEHGCSKHGSPTGCGVNYAHLHILVEPRFSLKAFRAMVAQLVNQQSIDFVDVHTEARMRLRDYHAFGGNGSSYTPYGSGNLGSQFFRKVVANLANRSDCWDYRRHTFEANVKETIKAFTSD